MGQSTNDKQYDAVQPIKTQFEQIKQGIEFSNDANNHFSGKQVLTKAYNLIQQTGKYT